MSDDRARTDAAAGCAGDELAAAVRALREPVPVRAEWRAALLRALAEAPPPRALGGAAPAEGVPNGLPRRWPGRWLATPARAAAAALLCAGLGAAATYAAMRGASPAARAGSGVEVARGAPAAGAAPGLVVPAAAGVATVRFTIAAAGAARVSVVGDFNRWDPAATPLRRTAEGDVWTVTVPLPPGRHVYAFVVDGGLTADPAAPRAADDDFGAPNSVVIVAGASS